jgi:O-antigen/teichoic acid export membrane protein
MGLGETSTKYVAELRERDPARAGRVLGMVGMLGLATGTLMALACFGGSAWLASAALGRADLAPLLRLAAPVLIPATLDGVQLAPLAGFEPLLSVATLNVCNAVLSIAITAPLVYFFGLRGALVGQIAVSSFSALLSALALRAEGRRRGVPRAFGRRAFAEWRVVCNYAIPAMGANVLFVPVSWFANLMLVRLVPDGRGFAELGSVNVVFTLRSVVNYLPTVLLAPSLAIMANSLSQPERLTKTLRYCLTVSALTVFPVALAVTVMGRFVLGTLYGHEFTGATTMLAWAMAVAAIQAAGSSLGNVILATGRMWLALSVNLTWAVLFLAFNAVLIPRYYGTGYLAAMGISYVLLTAIFFAGFHWKARYMLAGYPLGRMIGVFLALLAGAGYVASHAGLGFISSAALAVGASVLMAAILLAAGDNLGLIAQFKRSIIARRAAAAAAAASGAASPAREEPSPLPAESTH